MEKEPFIIKIQLIVIVLLWSLFSCMCFFIITHRIRRNARNKFLAALGQETEKWIYETILNDDFDGWIKSIENTNKFKEYYEKNYAHKLQRELLIDILVKLRTSLIGEVKHNLREFFLLLGLDTHVLQMMERNSWSEKAKAIRIIADMGITHASRAVGRYLNYPQPILRREARLAYVLINPSNLNYFFQKVTTPISGWEMINIIETINTNKTDYLLAFNPAYSDTNPTLSLLSLKIINTFKLNAFSTDVAHMLNHFDRRVVNHAIQTIGNLAYTPALSLLMLKYDEFEYREKIAILSVISSIGSVNETAFLLKVMQESKDDTILLYALRAIVSSGMHTDDIYSNLTDFIDKNKLDQLMAHILDKRIIW